MQILCPIHIFPFTHRSQVKSTWKDSKQNKGNLFHVTPTLKYVRLCSQSFGPLDLTGWQDKPVYPNLSIYPPIAVNVSIPSQHGTQNSVLASSKPRAGRNRRSHRDLHQEVYHDSSIRTPSGTGLSRPEIRPRPLDVPPSYGHRRISTTRSPTGPALHKSATPPALPNKFSIPSSPTNGIPHLPNIMDQMTELRTETSTTRFSLSTQPPSGDAITATRKVTMTLS